MVEATRRNFEEAFTELQYELKNCSFVSVDCEFTSLPSDKHFETSFFDSGDDRYNNIRKNLDHVVILQVGLTPFKYCRDLNHFKANPFKFYIFPKVFGPFNVSFTCKSSTIQFLCDHKFDFNKGYYDGISYLNRTNKEVILKLLHNDSLLNCLEENLNHDEGREILRICEFVKKWKVTSEEHGTVEFPVDPDNHAFNYLLRERICLFNEEVWAQHEQNKIVIRKVSREERIKLMATETIPEVREKFIDSLLGFTKVYHMLAASKKPLVGHNMYLDLMIMYHQFYEDLPTSYSKFKSNLNELFPSIFDTKFLSYQLQRTSKQKNCIENSLGSLFDLFQDSNTLFHYPSIILDTNSAYCSPAEQKKHDAGWDSYMTGFVFLKIASQFAQLKRNTKVVDNLTFIELITVVKEWENKVNIARAKISHVSLQGKDPQSTRPPLLHVQRRNKESLSKLELDTIFMKYEPVHKKLLSSNSAVLAVPNYTCFKLILTDFDKSKLIKVEKYSMARHDLRTRACYVAVIFLPLVLAAWAGFKIRH